MSKSTAYNAFTTTDWLVPSVRRFLGMGTSDVTFSEAEICQFATDTLRSEVWPKVMTSRADYAVRYQTISLVAGQQTYDLSADCWAGTVRDVLLQPVDTSSTPSGVPMAYCDAVELEQMRLNSPYGSTAASMPRAFTILDSGQVKVWPAPTAGAVSQWTLRVIYTLEPTILVPTSQAVYVDDNGAVSTTAIPVVTVDANVDPVSTWTSLNAETNPNFVYFDVIKAQPPFNYLVSQALLSTNSTNTSVEVDTALDPDFTTLGIEGGDWITRSGYSVLPMVPTGFNDMLVWGTVAKCAFALSKWDVFEKASQIAAFKMGTAKDTIMPRAESHPRKMRPVRFSRRWGV